MRSNGKSKEFAQAAVKERLARESEAPMPVDEGFSVPPRYATTYRNLLDNGHSIIHARQIVEKNVARDKEAMMVRYEKDMKKRDPSLKGLAWSRLTGEWVKDKPADEEPWKLSKGIAKSYHDLMNAESREEDEDYERNEDPP